MGDTGERLRNDSTHTFMSDPLRSSCAVCVCVCVCMVYSLPPLSLLCPQLRLCRSDFDADEAAEEERERRVRNELNKGFRRFVEKVQEIAERDPGGFRSFEIPTTELTFT